MNNKAINAQLFYKDSINIIYSLSLNNNDRYFLNIPVAQYSNFMTFLKLRTEDNKNKGTSEYSDERIKRKEFLEDIKKANDFVITLNNSMVYSRVNHLKELPVKELENVLDENKPFNMQEYKEIAKIIEDIINQNFVLMTSYNIKKESIEQTILLIEQNEQDKNFVEWLKNNLYSNYTEKNLADLRMEYKKQTVQLNIDDYQEVINNDKRYIIGKNSNGEMFSVEIPKQYNMLQVFEMELKTIDKTKLINLDNKLVASILFDKIILDLPSEKMVKSFDDSLDKKENYNELNLLNNQINNNIDNYMIDKKNNIAIDPINENTIAIENNDNGQIIANDAEVNAYNFNPNTGQPSQTETIVQSKGKRRVLVPSNNVPNGNSGFIKMGTIILFGLSFVLTIISLILLISS